jgi:hypothetical protein
MDHRALRTSQTPADLHGPSWPLWTLVDPCGPLWTLVDPCGPLWTLVNPCGPLWTLVDPCGPLWTLVGPCGPLRTLADPRRPSRTLADSHKLWATTNRANFNQNRTAHGILKSKSNFFCNFHGLTQQGIRRFYINITYISESASSSLFQFCGRICRNQLQISDGKFGRGDRDEGRVRGEREGNEGG